MKVDKLRLTLSLLVLVALLLSVLPVSAQGPGDPDQSGLPLSPGLSPAEAPPVEAWVARYNGPPGNDYDVARAIAVDGAGNVYVTGTSISAGLDSDYATIKYDANGNQLWAARYNGPSNDVWSMDDQVFALALDASGNVYVTGASPGVGTTYDYATIKYDGNNGNQLWEARYNGPGNEGDSAHAIALDGAGNVVYVTGTSRGAGPFYDYTTIKYNATNGSQLWEARYHGPGNSANEAQAIAVDGAGNVYVTGFSAVGANYDYATIKYNSNGSQLWEARYNGPGNSIDYARAIALDGLVNVYVTGYSVSATQEDYATIKYDATNGSELWAARYNGPASGPDYARAIALDGVGKVYVTGWSLGFTGDDSATIKYDDANGNQLWEARYNGPANANDLALDIALDGAGKVYVTGGSTGIGTGRDYATIKYDANGSPLWVARYNGPPWNGDDGSSAIALDGAGNVYVTGASVGVGTGYDYATIKYVPAQPVAVNGKETLIDTDGVAVLVWKIVDTIDPVTLLHQDVISGLGAYVAKATYNGAKIDYKGIRGGTVPFDTVTMVNIDNPGGMTAWAALQTTMTPGPQAPIAVSKEVLILTGTALETVTLTQEFLQISSTDGLVFDDAGPITKNYRRGDCKADGVVNIADVLFGAQYLAGLRQADEDISKVHAINCASVKHDNIAPEGGDKITISDVLKIAQYLVGIVGPNF